MTSPVRPLTWRPGKANAGPVLAGWRTRIGANRGVLAVLALALVIGVVELIVSDPKTLFWDFRSAYYPGGAAVLHGTSLSPLIHKGIWGFVNLPLVAWLFAPFALLPAKFAALVFTLIGLFALGIAYLLLADLAGLNRVGRAWLVLAMAANGPLIYSLKLGNTSHIVLAMLAGGLWLLRRRLALLAGILLGLAALIKLPLLLFGIYFILRRQYRAALGFFGLALLAFAGSVALFGMGLHAQWYQDAIRTFNSHALAAFNVQSIQSFMLRLREPPPPLADWRLYVPGRELRVAALGVTLFLYGLLVWTCALPKRPSEPGLMQDRLDREYMAVMVLCLISSPLSWTHYYCWLLLPAAFAIGRFTQSGARPWSALLAMLLVTPPVVLLSPANAVHAALYERLFVSTYLLGGLLWFATLILAKARWQIIQRP